MAASIVRSNSASPPSTWGYTFTVTNLATGANALTFPSGQGPTGLGLDHTPTMCRITPFNTGAIGTLVTYDPATLSATGVTLYATAGSATTGCILEVW